MKDNGIDLSGYRLVPIEEVAALFGKSGAAITAQVYRGTFEVPPKTRRPLRWSSVALRKYFEDTRR